MPPPHFAAAAGGGGSAPGNAAGATLNDLPKAQRHLVRDALQHIRASLASESTTSTGTNKASPAAYECIRKLIGDDALQSTEDSGSAQTSASGWTKGLTTSAEGVEVNTSAASSAIEALTLRRNVSTVVNSALSHIFAEEMDQNSRPHTQLLVSYLHALHSILDPMCVVLEWWDVLLRPTLKNPQCNPSIARKAHSLVVWVMRSTPANAYFDEPAPSAIWPAPPQSALAADMARMPRKPGDAPYPSTSTQSVSVTRSSEDGDARRLALFSTKLPQTGRNEPIRRFTQRIFDLYTSEASSAGTDGIEDDDIKEVAADEPTPGEKDFSSSVNELEVGPTWKGNLEAIILTFGEEKPKAFFHHLSESFLDPPARIPILLLLTIFFRISSLHAYHVVRTPFVRLLILSLQLDTSKTSAALGSFALATLIPHIPNWIANGGAGGLPALLSILARIIDWRKLGPQWEERTSALVNDGGDEVEEWSQVERISRRLHVQPEIEWKRLDTTFDTIMPEPPNAEKLFTFLYGIFPCNVIRFLRAPVDYLRKAEYESPFKKDWDDIIDEIAVQNKAAPILRRHVLHPSLVDMDAESEISDKQRWRDHDAADITAECVCLHIGGHTDDMDSRRPSMIDHLPSLLAFRTPSVGSVSMQQQEVDTSSTTPIRFYRQRTKSENLGRRGSVDSPLFELPSVNRRRDLSAQPGQQAGASMLRSPRFYTAFAPDTDVFLQNHVKLRYGSPSGGGAAAQTGDPSLSRSSSVKSGLRTFNLARTTLASTMMSPTNSENVQLPDASIPPVSSPPLVQQADAAQSGASPSRVSDMLGSPAFNKTKSRLKEEVKQMIAYLKQENLQLRNELNYEIGQKDQMLRHIGRIHRDRMRDTVLEDERQNLYQAVRSLRAQLNAVRATQERSKAEAVTSKSRHASWENELNAKLKSFREEKKVWANEVRQLQIAKEDNEALIAKLELQLHDNANEVFELREQCKRDAKKVEAIHEYEEKIRRLEECLTTWDADMRKFEAQRQLIDSMGHRYEQLTMELETMDVDRKKAENEAAYAKRQSDALQVDVEALRSAGGQRKSFIFTTATGKESEETTRLRARVQHLEAELLDAKARQEEWQMEELCRRLQHHEDEVEEIAPLDL